MKKLIAKTVKGVEFFHSKENAYFVSENSQRICDVLNKANYQLKDNEIWHIYDMEYTMSMYVDKRIWMTKNGSIKISSI